MRMKEMTQAATASAAAGSNSDTDNNNNQQCTGVCAFVSLGLLGLVVCVFCAVSAVAKNKFAFGDNHGDAANIHNIEMHRQKI